MYDAHLPSIVFRVNRRCRLRLTTDIWLMPPLLGPLSAMLRRNVT